MTHAVLCNEASLGSDYLSAMCDYDGKLINLIELEHAGGLVHGY